MRYNSLVSGHPKSTGIPRVDELSTGPLDLGCHGKWVIGFRNGREEGASLVCQPFYLLDN